MGSRHNCCKNQKMKRGLWCREEDERLLNYINAHGTGQWASVAKKAGLQRCGKSCRLRWLNYLSPAVKKGPFSDEEEIIIRQYHRMLGNKWSQIAKLLPGRTDNDVKNFWNSCIKKKLELEEKGKHLALNSPYFSTTETNFNVTAADLSQSSSLSSCMGMMIPGSPALGLSLSDPSNLMVFNDQQSPQFVGDYPYAGPNRNGPAETAVQVDNTDSGSDHELMNEWWNASMWKLDL